MRAFVGATVAGVLAIGVASACDDASSSPAPLASSDAGADVVDAAPACANPSDAPEWLDSFLAERLATLTAQPDRGTSEHRKIAREWLRDELTALGFTTTIEPYVAATDAGDAGSAGDGANVVARLGAIGGDTKEWVLVGAHYDTVEGSPGANDNASGTVAALAVAKLARGLPCRERGLIMAFFDEEELGLRGSTALASSEAQAGTNIIAVHTMDQLGWNEDGDTRFEIELPTAELFAAYQASAGTVGVVVVKTRIDGSDHQAFREHGFAAAGVTEEYVSRDTSPHRHAPTDTRETVNLDYLALGTRLVADVVARQLHPEPP